MVKSIVIFTANNDHKCEQIIVKRNRNYYETEFDVDMNMYDEAIQALMDAKTNLAKQKVDELQEDLENSEKDNSDKCYEIDDLQRNEEDLEEQIENLRNDIENLEEDISNMIE